MTSAPLKIVPLSPADLDAGVAERAGSFLQLSSWGLLKAEWASERIGWMDPEGELHGVGLVLHRRLPRIGRSLAYLPEGPVLPWDEVAADPARFFDPLIAHARAKGAFTLRVGCPDTARSWTPATIKAGLADEHATSIYDLAPDAVEPDGSALIRYLTARGFHRADGGSGFAAGQPRLTAALDLTGQTEASLLKGMNQLWRRNIKAADKAGVTVRTASPETLAADLEAWHRCYVETAERDRFTPRPASYFTKMAELINAPGSPARLDLNLAELDGQLLAASICVTLADRCWYLYGASTAERREARGANAVQWYGMRRALAEGCRVYDMRGITADIAADNPLAGLVRFKQSAGCAVQERVGEWDLPLNKVLHAAFTAYLRRRG